MLGTLRAALRCLWLVVLSSGTAFATTADNLCARDANPCIVRNNVRVDPDSVIDVGERHLLISNGAALSVEGGRMSLLGERLTVESGGAVRALGTGSGAGGAIEVTMGFISIAGRVEATGSPGGSLVLESSGELGSTGIIDASSRSREEDGGSLTLRAGSINLSGPVTATGGRDATGGDVEITARGGILISRNVEASGGDGGVVIISAGADGAGNLTVGSGGRIVADALVEDGLADTIELSAEGDGINSGHVVMDGLVSASGSANASGGCISVSADGNILGASTAAAFRAVGGRPNGDGGEVSFVTFLGRLETLATVATVGDTEGMGGEISFDIAGPANLIAPMSANGGARGGTIDGRSGADITVSSILRSDGPGAAAAIDLEGCTILIDDPGSLSSLGSNGANRLTGRNLTVVRGSILADVDTGTSEIRYGNERREPVIFEFAVVMPPAINVFDATLLPCSNVPTPTPTLTVTPTRTPTSTRTPTVTPPAGCAGDCDGNGTVTVDDIVGAARIILEGTGSRRCRSVDTNGDDQVTIDELLVAIDNALSGCATPVSSP